MCKLCTGNQPMTSREVKNTIQGLILAPFLIIGLWVYYAVIGIVCGAVMVGAVWLIGAFLTGSV